MTHLDLRENFFANMPDPDSGVVSTFNRGGLSLRFLKSPRTASGEELVRLSYAVVAFKDDRYIAAAVIEREDLRSLSARMKLSLRELQSEYGIKGYLASPSVVIYLDGDKECIGRSECEEGEDEEVIKDYLLEFILAYLEEEEE